MELFLGTRSFNQNRNEHPSSRGREESFTRDLGLTKNVTAAITFVNGATQQLQAANGTFAAFVVGDLIFVAGSNLNDGEFTVVAIDVANHAFLQVDNGCKNEGPVNATVRTV